VYRHSSGLGWLVTIADLDFDAGFDTGRPPDERHAQQIVVLADPAHLVTHCVVANAGAVGEEVAPRRILCSSGRNQTASPTQSRR
jgi:hypothetical protein